MELKLKKPIVFFDLETTGISITSDRIVEISMLKIGVNGEEQWFTTRVNPEMHIPAQATEVHHITDEDVKDCPKFKEIAKNVASFIEGADLAGYNSIKFDIPLLAEEFLRADVNVDLKHRHYIDVQVIFHKKEPRTLVAAYQFYCKKNLEEAHSAKGDVAATYEVLKSQLDTYSDIENDIEKLSEYTDTGSNYADFAGRIAYNSKGEEVLNFGKNKGRTIRELSVTEPGYLSWFLESDFPLYTKKIITEIMLSNKVKR